MITFYNKMREMTSEIASLEENLTRREEIHAAQVLSLETNLEGMKRQFVSLSDQLAQRTVLYESQERRWRSMLTSKSSLFTERSNEFVKLSARFEQLQEQFLRVDAERLDAVVDNRELRATLSNLHAEHSDEKERLSIAEQELSTATQRIQDIQIELERIKGTDITELEQSMAAEALLIRERASDRENEIMRQVEHLRESLAQVSMEKEQFLDEIHHLKQHNRSLEELLHELRNHNFDGSHTLELSHVDHHYDGNSELASSAVVAEPRAVASQVNGVRGQSACGSEECYESDVDDDYGAAAGGDGGGEEEAAAATERTQGLDESYLTGQSGRSEADEMSALLRQRTYEASEAKSRKLELQLQEKQAECGFLISNIGILKEQVCLFACGYAVVDILL
jgi:myosin heavy subunit